jgi:hypothetical protein
VGCASPSTTILSGVALGKDGPLPGAVVRVQTTEYSTITDRDGSFLLDVTDLGEGPYQLTGWAQGYFCSGPMEAYSSTDEIEIHLIPHHDFDNPEYAWLPSEYHAGQGENQGCAECHSSKGTDYEGSLPVDEWKDDAHSKSATNPLFLTMYNGTDLLGNQSPITQFGRNPDYGPFPLPPDPDLPYFGPGYKLDFPTTTGNCASCHTPAAAVNAPYNVDPNILIGATSEGTPCDFCHKVWDVVLDPDTGFPFPNMSGVLSFEFRRPPDGHQFFAGPYDDVAPGEDTYSPLQTQSQFCAPCHFGVFWDTVIYNSFGEWIESSYNDPEGGQTCQDCHMPRLDVEYFALPDKGGLERDPMMIYSHRMPGAADEEFLQNAVSMTVDPRREGEHLIVEVAIVNDQTGHHVPTDSPLRHMILFVEASDLNGELLVQADGPTVPAWGGIGDPEEGYYGGLPGKAYAKVLQELWTEVMPSGAYWNPTRIVSDNRIAANESDLSTYTFALNTENKAQVKVTLIFRRAFIGVIDQKAWESADIIMEQETLTVP